MRKYYLIIISTLIFLGCQTETKNWWKGNLHTHSYWSDGDDYPEQIMDWYKTHGYDFVALSDHNILAEGDKWIEFDKDTRQDSVFHAYFEAYGEEWIEYEDQGDVMRVKLKTLEEYRQLFEDPDSFLIIRSEEITDGYEGKPVHVNATNIQELIEPRGGSSVADVMQNNIDAVHAQREETGEPMFPHINHPNFGWAVTAGDLKELEGERFFEVYNGHPLVHNEGDSLRSGTEQMWDEVNTYYVMEDKELMYGIAVDDAHDYHTASGEHANPGRGWVYVRSSELAVDAIIEAMEQGDFYSSTGVELKDISFDGDLLQVEVLAEEGVEYEIQFIGTLSDDPSKTGVILQSHNGSTAEYSLTGNEFYVRAKVISNKEKENPYREGETEVAWIQPVTGN